MKLLDRGRERKKRAFTPSIAAAAATSTSFWECWCRRIFSCKRCNLNSTQLRYACENNFSKWLPLSRNRRCRRRRSCLPSWWADASEQKKNRAKEFCAWELRNFSYFVCSFVSNNFMFFFTLRSLAIWSLPSLTSQKSVATFALYIFILKLELSRIFCKFYEGISL